MPILESQLNGRIATLLGRMAPEWNARGENKGAFQGNQKQPDILITQTGAQLRLHLAPLNPSSISYV